MAIVLCGCSREEPAAPAPADKAPSPSVAVAADAPAAPAPIDAAVEAPGDDDTNTIRITVSKKRPAGSGVARRCALGGDPIVGDCVGGGSGLAFDRGGTLYVVAGGEVRRYKRATGAEECRFDAAGAAVPLPAETQRRQPIDKGPVFMRSGGPAWHLSPGAGGAVLAVDYLGGTFRVDRGKSEPVCADVFGYESVASVGGALYVVRRGLERLTPGVKCTAASAKLDDKARGNAFGVRDKLHVAGRGASGVLRWDGTRSAPIAEGARICSVVAIVPCGDKGDKGAKGAKGACVVDNNCAQVVQVGAHGGVVRKLASDAMFDRRPYTIESAAAHAEDLFLLARHKAGDACEAAVYQLPAALFAD
ncbi:MAG: hypothetical protein KF773_02080 [Deltaproteobacteria bacterium]|nr:hypothetical protein [Deltaproteobacteria bacterium]